MNPNKTEERRGSRRIPRRESASIQLVFPGEDGSCRPEVATSVTLDVSIQGFRLLLSKALEPGHIYDVCVELADDPKRFLLTGETRWCHYSEKRSGYEVGIEILEGDGTDFEVWARHFEPTP